MRNLPYGGDLNFHLKRIQSIKLNFENNLFNYPIYFKYLNGYGYASGLFYPDLFLNIPAILNYIGIDLFSSYKIFLVLIKFFSLISIYITVKTINKDNKSAIFAIFLYALSSYCFIDMFERGALAETITIIFIPIVIKNIYEIIIEEKNKSIELSLSMLGLLYSHIISLYLMTFVIIIYLIIHIKKININKIKILIKSTLIFLLIGSHFILPLLEQMITSDFYYNNITNTNILKQNSVPLYLTFFEFPYYAFMNVITNRWIPCGIGIIYLYPIYKCIKDKTKIDEVTKKFTLLGIICILFASLSIIWNITILKNIFSFIQFPFRIYIIGTSIFIIALTRTVSKEKYRKLIIISFLLFGLNLIYPFINIKQNNLTTDEIMYGEYLPIEYPSLDYSIKRENIIRSNCKIKYKIIKNVRTEIEYETLCENIELEIPIIYYKGYNVILNNKKMNIEKSENGLIKIQTNEKKGNIEIIYTGTSIYNVTKYISFTTIIIILSSKLRYVICKKKKN